MVGQSDFTNDWHQVDNGKFVTSRDRKCLQNFITPDDEPDIVFIELSVNDYEYIHIELLTRRILSLKSFPLVLYVSLVNFVNKCASLSSAKNPRCHNSEELGQRELATHYGITLLSWRDILVRLI